MKKTILEQELKILFFVFLEVIFNAPNFEEVEGAYWFGPVRPSVRPSVCLSVTLFGSSETQEPLMLES